MIRGFYTAVAGLVSAMTRQSIVADAIANVNTVGYKRDRSGAASFELALSSSLTGDQIGRLGTGTYATDQPIDRSPGPIEMTGNPTDLAIEGDGLFVVATDTGFALTRAGNFSISVDGRLVNQNGHPVLDTNAQPITLTGALNVAPDGTVEGTGRRLAVIAWPAGGVDRLGENLLAPIGQMTLGSGRVRQGALEKSNVDLAESMTELISLQRQFSFAARALTLQEDSLTDANQLGRLR
jgi:flagellar basal-body rod protein FlgF